MENSLHIKVRDTKNIKMPFNIQIQENIFPDPDDVRQEKIDKLFNLVPSVLCT